MVQGEVRISSLVSRLGYIGMILRKTHDMIHDSRFGKGRQFRFQFLAYQIDLPIQMSCYFE